MQARHFVPSLHVGPSHTIAFITWRVLRRLARGIHCSTRRQTRYNPARTAEPRACTPALLLADFCLCPPGATQAGVCCVAVQAQTAHGSPVAPFTVRCTLSGMVYDRCAAHKRWPGLLCARPGQPHIAGRRAPLRDPAFPAHAAPRWASCPCACMSLNLYKPAGQLAAPCCRVSVAFAG